MITLYAPEKPPEPHKCDPGVFVSFKRPEVAHGAVIACRTCGQLWYADVGNQPGAESPIYSVFWRKVRWYHFDLRKKARENG